MGGGFADANHAPRRAVPGSSAATSTLCPGDGRLALVTPRAAFDAAHEFAERLRALFGARVEWVRLYGSQARGEAREESDVDVLAVVRDLSWKEKIAAIELGCDVSLARTLHISPVVMATADFDRLIELESSFARNVLADGVAA
jgi:predicted nucleotidyltransferase